MGKPELRTEFRNRRKKITAGGLYGPLSLRAQEHLLADVAWKQAGVVVLYHAVRGEADTKLLVSRAWREGRQVFLPRCIPGAKGEMELLFYGPTDDLVVSSLGIPEPRQGARMMGEAELAEALIVVPALAFDAGGYRLGYGGGYYDRLLARPRGLAVGLTFNELFVERLPRDRWDIPVDAVCTEEGMQWV